MELLQYFAQLSAVPRISGDEEAVAHSLMNTLTGLGLVPEKDSAHNLRCLLPASPGCENAPGVILQAHTDMVCVKAPGADYRPGQDPIRLRREDGFLRSDGRSSLGADNGIAVAAMLALAEKRTFDHGPILLLFTACEERGLVGAKALDPSWLEGFQYYINLDAFRGDAAIFASAGGLRQSWSHPITTAKGVKPCAFTVALTGLTGGHSGFDIHRGRGNAIVLLLQTLAGYPLEIAWIDGGSDYNAIPTSIMAVVTVEDGADFRDYIARQHRYLTDVWGDTDPNLVLTADSCQYPRAVWDEATRRDVLNFFAALPQGVQAWREDLPNTVARSANPAVLKDEGTRVRIGHFTRCATQAGLNEVAEHTASAARHYNFTPIECSSYAPWDGSADNRLIRLAQTLYRGLTGCGMEAVALHVGLESSLILEKNPQLTGIALGCDIFDAHSVSERVDLDSIHRMEQLILELLKQLSKEERK